MKNIIIYMILLIIKSHQISQNNQKDNDDTNFYSNLTNITYDSDFFSFLEDNSTPLLVRSLIDNTVLLQINSTQFRIALYTEDKFNRINLLDLNLFSSFSSMSEIDYDDSLTKETLPLTRLDNYVLIRNKQVYIQKNNTHLLSISEVYGKKYDKGFIFPIGITGFPYTNIPTIVNNSIAIISVLNDNIVGPKGQPVYYFSKDWMLRSTYNPTFKDVVPIEVLKGEDFFEGEDYKYFSNMSQVMNKIPIGSSIKSSLVNVINLKGKYYLTYNGLPLYISNERSEGDKNIHLKEENGGKYFLVDKDGNLIISDWNEEKRIIIPFSEEFEKLNLSFILKIRFEQLVLLILIILIIS